MTEIGRSWLVRVLLGALTVAAIIFFISTVLQAQRDGGMRWPVEVSWSWVALSVAIGVVHVAVMGGAFAWLIGLHVWGRVTSIFLFSQAAKYVPGRIWGVVAQQALMGGQSKLSRLLGANVAMTAILFASQLAMAVAGLLVVRVGIVVGVGAGLAMCVFAGAVATLLQRIYSAKGWRLLVPWARPGVGLLTGGGSFVSLVLTSSAWVTLFGGGLGYPSVDVAHWTAVSGASFIAGTISLLPGGLGLREAAFVAFGGQIEALTPSDAPMLSLLTRVWLLVIDLFTVLLGGVGLVILRVRGRA